MSLSRSSRPANSFRWKVLAGAVLGMAGHPAWTQGSSIKVVLRPRVEVGAQIVALGEVAEVSGEDSSLLRRLRALPLGKAPQGGEGVVLGREGLARWVQIRLGAEARRIAWEGAAATRVESPTVRLEGARLETRARAALKDFYAQHHLRAELQAVRTPQDLLLPPGPLELKAEPLAARMALERPGQRGAIGALTSRRQTVRVEVNVKGQALRTVPVVFEARIFGPGYVAARDLDAGEPLEQRSFAVHEVEWTGRDLLPVVVPEPFPKEAAGAEPPSAVNPEVLPPLRARRAMKAGEPISRAQVEPLPEVCRGDFAILRAQQGAVTLESRVEILRDGRIGQVVPVKLPGASSSIQATVAGSHIVEVRP